MSSKQIFKGKLLNLITQKVRLPNGYVAHLEVIKHPGAALVIPFLSQDKIILLRQFRPVIKKYIYELPAGTLGKKETPLTCARREIIEETGYAAGKFTRIGHIYPVPGYSTEKIIIYKAEKLKKQKVRPEKDELIKIKIVSKKHLGHLLKLGKINDAKTISALALSGILNREL